MYLPILLLVACLLNERNSVALMLLVGDGVISQRRDFATYSFAVSCASPDPHRAFTAMALFQNFLGNEVRSYRQEGFFRVCVVPFLLSPRGPG